MNGTRYESRQVRPASFSFKDDAITIKGIQLCAAPESEPVAEENWELRVKGDALVWSIDRKWLRPMSLKL
jgi:hypothetical protein